MIFLEKISAFSKMQDLESEPVDERIEAKRAKLLARLHGRHANNQTSSSAGKL